MKKKGHARKAILPVVDYKIIAKPMISPVIYSVIAIVALCFLMVDLVNLFNMHVANISGKWFHEPALERLLLSMFGAGLSLWSDLDVKSIFNLKENEVHGQEHIQLFGYLLCLLPIIAEIMSAGIKEVASLSVFATESLSIFCEVHNAFMVVYSLVILVLLGDISWYFIRKCYKTHK